MRAKPGAASEGIKKATLKRMALFIAADD